MMGIAFCQYKSSSTDCHLQATNYTYWKALHHTQMPHSAAKQRLYSMCPSCRILHTICRTYCSSTDAVYWLCDCLVNNGCNVLLHILWECMAAKEPKLTCMPRVNAGSGLWYSSCAADRLPLATAMTQLHEYALVVRVCKAGGIQGSGCCECCVWHAPIHVEVLLVGHQQAFHAAGCSPLQKQSV